MTETANIVCPRAGDVWSREVGDDTLWLLVSSAHYDGEWFSGQLIVQLDQQGNPLARFQGVHECSPGNMASLGSQAAEAGPWREIEGAAIPAWVEPVRSLYSEMINHREDATRWLDRYRQAQATAEDFKDRIRERLVQYANDHDLCSEFDDFLVDFGMEPRKRPYTVDFDIEARITIRVEEASDADNALDQARSMLSIGEGDTLRMEGHDVYIRDVASGDVDLDN